jgi:phosphomannomutase/phosphoglucomutase (PMM /PGM)
VRASNTTPVIVTRFEAKSKEFLKEIEQKVTNLLKSLM